MKKGFYIVFNAELIARRDTLPEAEDTLERFISNGQEPAFICEVIPRMRGTKDGMTAL